jgi:molybdenum cofactor guanylyltransferase
MIPPASSVILAGGASRRMGRDKAFLELSGRPLIASIAHQVRVVGREVIVAGGAGGDVARYAPFADVCVPDVYPGVGTLGGIHAGLQVARHDLALVVACDMPFLNPQLLAWFLSAAKGWDLVVLKHDQGVEPLHAVYRKTCLPVIEATIRSGERCAFAFYDQIRVRFVRPAEIAHLDSDLCSFRNLNTPQDWQAALAQTRTPGKNGGPPAR